MPKKLEYKIVLGNSTAGQIGAVAYMTAANKKEALISFKVAVGYCNHAIIRGTDGVNVQVYFNPGKVTLRDVSVAD